MVRICCRATLVNKALMLSLGKRRVDKSGRISNLPINIKNLVKSEIYVYVINIINSKKQGV